MSSSDAGPGAARVELASSNPLLEITLIGPDFSPVASGIGRLTVAVPPGIYQIATRAGPVVERELISLSPGESHVDENLSVAFPSAAPMDGTSTTHQSHQDLAQLASGRSSTASPTAGWLVIVVRDVRGSDGPPLGEGALRRVTLLDGKLRPVPGFGSDWDLRAQDAAAAWSGGLAPGPYVLRTQGGGAETAIDQSIWLQRGWQTVVFLTLGPAGPMPESASVHMVENGLHWSPDERVGRATELAGWALREGRPVVPPDLVDLMLHTKFQNPMLGLLGAHALLLQPAVDFTQLDVVLGNLDSLIPRHPDLVALHWMTEERRALASGTDLPAPGTAPGVDWPPMLLVSYQALIRMDARDPGAIHDGSIAERVAGNLTVQGIWTAWRPIARVAEAEAVEQPAPPPPTESARGGWRPRRAARKVARDTWQPELETGEVLAGLAPSIGVLSRRRYRDPATQRVAHYLGSVAELEGPKWTGARFGEITTAELALATQLPSGTVDRSLRELRLVSVTEGLPQTRDGGGNGRGGGGGGGGGGDGFRWLLALIVAIIVLFLVGLGAAIATGVIVIDPEESPTPSPSASPSASPSTSASPTATPTASPSPTPTPAPTPPPVGNLVVAPDLLDFGRVVVGFEATLPVRILNDGTAPLVVEPGTISGPDTGEFSLTDVCDFVELAPGFWCTIEVTFRPTNLDLRQATLVIEGGGLPPIEISLSGIGDSEGRLEFDPTSIDFGLSPPSGIRVFATGPVVIDDVSLVGNSADAYEADKDACRVALAAAGESCFVAVEFIGEFDCSSQRADLIFTTFVGQQYPVRLVANVVC